jgi:hypothetical protein
MPHAARAELPETRREGAAAVYFPRASIASSAEPATGTSCIPSWFGLPRVTHSY